MYTGQGTTLQGATLTEHGARVTSGKFSKDTGRCPNVVECYADGTIDVEWTKGGTPETIAFTSGWVNPIECYSVEVKTGTFNLAWL